MSAGQEVGWFLLAACWGGVIVAAVICALSERAARMRHGASQKSTAVGR